MAHIIKLGFSKNPSTGTGGVYTVPAIANASTLNTYPDFIDLGGGVQGGTNFPSDWGAALPYTFHPNSFKEGDPYTDNYGRQMIDFTFDVTIESTQSVGQCFEGYRRIQHFINSGALFLETLNGVYGAAVDGSFYSGRVPLLTLQFQGSSKKSYWEIVGGQTSLPDVLLGPDLLNFHINNLIVTLTCNFPGKGDSISASNGVRCGDFQYPFVLSLASSDPLVAGWTIPNLTDWTLSNPFYSLTSTNILGMFPQGPNSRCLHWNSNGSTITATTVVTNSCTWGAPHNGYATINDRSLFASIWVAGNWQAGTPALELWAGGSKFADLTSYQVFDPSRGPENPNLLTPAVLASSGGAFAQWVQFIYTSTVPYDGLAGSTFYQLKIVSPTKGTLYYDGAAIYLCNNVVTTPFAEYFTQGGTFSIPTFNVYNVQGDMDAPCTLSLMSPFTSNTARSYVMGGSTVKDSAENPLQPLDLVTASGSSNNAVYFGKEGAFTSSTSGTFDVGIVGGQLSRLNPSSSAISPVPLTLNSKKYIAYLYYSSDQHGTITQVQINLGSDTRIYNVSLPATCSAVATGTHPVASGYKFYELGDFFWPRPGSIGSNEIYYTSNTTVFSGAGVLRFIYTNTGAGYVNIAIGGIVLIPAETVWSCDLVTTTSNYCPIFSSENSLSKTQVMRENFSWNHNDNIQEITVVDSTALAVMDEVLLKPGDMQFAYLQFLNRDGTDPRLYTISLNPITIGLAYTPRLASAINY